VRGSIRLPRHIAQLSLGLFLVAVLAIVGVLTSFAPLRADVAQSAHVAAGEAYVSAVALTSTAIVVIPHPWCGTSGGNCP
jgi:hypothetical protein